MPRHFDYIVVGAGAAGCALASRLSERSAQTVLLLEAGVDVLPGSEPADIADLYPTSYFNRNYFWNGLTARWNEAPGAADTPFPQARVMGGGGAVMGMVALRGTPRDYDDWERAGARGWGWHEVLPYFRKLENDWDFPDQGDLHGIDGPVPIRRLAREAWPPLARAVEQYCRAQDMPFIADMNGDFRDGYGAVPMSNTTGRRASSAICYLDGRARKRANLTIMTSAPVRSILCEGRRATGVTVSVAGRTEEFYADEVILCAGAIFSPALLMRAGIGPAAALRKLDIPVVADRPGVGANLQNHPVLFTALHLRRSARQAAQLRTTPTIGVRYSSGSAAGLSDIYINVQSKTSWNPLGQQIANVAPVLLRPLSRGSVVLASAGPQAHPRVSFNFMSVEDDVRRMAGAFRRTVEILACCQQQMACGTPFPVRFGDRIRKMNRLNRSNHLKTTLIAGLFDFAPVLADMVLTSLAGDSVSLQELAADPARLEDHIRKNVAGVFHPSGTCRMGSADDPAAVVDSAGKVYGIDCLRVADASIMPNIIAGNTNIPTIMIAEKIAAAVA